MDSPAVQRHFNSRGAFRYSAVSPKEVVERVKKNVTEDAKEQIKKLTDLKSTDVLNELDSLHSQGVELVEPSDLSGSLRGRHNLYNHLELLIKNANESVTLMTTSQGLLRKLEGLKPTFEKIFEMAWKNMKTPTDIIKKP